MQCLTMQVRRYHPDTKLQGLSEGLCCNGGIMAANQNFAEMVMHIVFVFTCCATRRAEND
jgi:hypothetical protein